MALAWRTRQKRDDKRIALLRFTMYSCFVKDPPKFEDLLPSDEADAKRAETEDERTMRKLDSVMFQYGGVVADRPKAQQAPPEEDEFTKKMWRLMGVSESGKTGGVS